MSRRKRKRRLVSVSGPRPIERRLRTFLIAQSPRRDVLFHHAEGRPRSVSGVNASTLAKRHVTTVEPAGAVMRRDKGPLGVVKLDGARRERHQRRDDQKTRDDEIALRHGHPPPAGMLERGYRTVYRLRVVAAQAWTCHTVKPIAPNIEEIALMAAAERGGVASHRVGFCSRAKLDLVQPPRLGRPSFQARRLVVVLVSRRPRTTRR